MPLIDAWELAGRGSVALAVNLSDMWQVTGDRWHATGDSCQVTGNTRHMTGDMWQVTGEMWQMIFLVCLFFFGYIFFGLNGIGATYRTRQDFYTKESPLLPSRQSPLYLKCAIYYFNKGYLMKLFFFWKTKFWDSLVLQTFILFYIFESGSPSCS